MGWRLAANAGLVENQRPEFDLYVRWTLEIFWGESMQAELGVIQM